MLSNISDVFINRCIVPSTLVTELGILRRSFQGLEPAQADGGFSAAPDMLKNPEFLTTVSKHTLILDRVQEPSRSAAVLRSWHSSPTLPMGNSLRALRPKADKIAGTRPRLSGSRSCVRDQNRPKVLHVSGYLRRCLRRNTRWQPETDEQREGWRPQA